MFFLLFLFSGVFSTLSSLRLYKSLKILPGSSGWVFQLLLSLCASAGILGIISKVKLSSSLFSLPDDLFPDPIKINHLKDIK
jgi:hypothetical protein